MPKGGTDILVKLPDACPYPGPQILVQWLGSHGWDMQSRPAAAAAAAVAGRGHRLLACHCGSTQQGSPGLW